MRMFTQVLNVVYKIILSWLNIVDVILEVSFPIFAHISLFDTGLVLVIFGIIWGLTKVTQFRESFIFFIFFIFFITIWGFSFGYDGVIFFFLLTEYLILLLFLIISLNNNAPALNALGRPISFSFFLIGAFFIYLYSLTFISSGFTLAPQWLYVSVRDVYSSDLFLFFYFFFLEFTTSVGYITLILSFFSIAFISLYFQLKTAQFKQYKLGRNYEILRKQEQAKQSTFRAQLRLFF